MKDFLSISDCSTEQLKELLKLSTACLRTEAWKSQMTLSNLQIKLANPSILSAPKAHFCLFPPSVP